MKALMLFSSALVLVGLPTLPAEGGRKLTVDEIIQTLEDPDKSQASKVDAIRQLEPYGKAAAPAVPVLTKIVEEAENPLAPQALQPLRAIGKPAVPALIAALKFEKLRHRAGLHLGVIGPDAQEAVPVMLALIEEQPKKCWGLFDPLDKIGADPKLVVPVAIRIIKASYNSGGLMSDAPQPDYALVSLVKAGPAAKEAVPTLIDLLKTTRNGIGRPGVTESAMQVLGEVGPEAAEALPVLRTYLDTGSGPHAEKAIAKIKAR